MNTLNIKFLFIKPEDYLNKEICLSGWVKTIRSSKEYGFMELSDGSAFKNIQIVFTNQVSNFTEVSKLSLGSSVKVNGIFVKSLGGGQQFEIQAQSIAIIGYASLKNPIQKKKHSYEYLRTIPHLRSRTNTFNAVFRVRSLIAFAIHEFFQKEGFVYVHTPIITTSDAEGAGEMFQVTTLDIGNKQGRIDYSEEILGKKTHLTVSGQLAVEPFCMGFRNVYTFGPTFRAENSNTPRHANEFWMIEPEMAFATLEDDMFVAENLLKYIIEYLLTNAKDEMQFFNSFVDESLLGRLNAILDSNFGHISYTEAVGLLQRSPNVFTYSTAWGENLQTEHERYLAEEIFKKPVFVTDYPKDIKAFYMKQNPDNMTVRAMDLLVPGVGEIIGGSQREEDLERLKDRMKTLGMNLDEYDWYFDTREYGTFPHSGFGLGFERVVMYLTGMKNIRDVLPYPRTPNNILF